MLICRFSTQCASLQVNTAMIFKERSIPLVFYETINYDFILLSKAGPLQLIYRGSGGKMIVA